MKYVEALEKLEALHAMLPSVACQGLCTASCGPLALSFLERLRLQRARGRTFGQVTTPACPLLKAGRCTLYPLRPTICYLYGVTESMPCGYGCVPERWVSVHECTALLHAVEEISQAVFPRHGTVSLHTAQAIVDAQERAAADLCHLLWGV